MILKHLLTGRQLSNFLLIQERDDCSCHLLIRNLIVNNLTQGKTVHVLNFENPFMTNYEEFSGNKSFRRHDFYFDPWRLNSDAKQTISEKISTVVSDEDVNIVVFDTLTYALMIYPLESILRAIAELLTHNNERQRTQIIGVINIDQISEDSIEFNEINRLSDTVVVASKSLDVTAFSITHRSSLGKCKDGEFEMKIIEGLDIDISERLKTVQKVPESTPFVASTFKLTLGDKEKESRSQVVLPYLKNTQSKIIYEPDENDDWDDEDPDDDLEI